MSAYLAHINVMTREELQEPLGEEAQAEAQSAKIKGVGDIRIGRHVTVRIFAKTINEAHRIAEKVCEKVLVDPEREIFDFVVEELD